MNNNTRDRTKEGLDPDNPGLEVVPPPQTPRATDSTHIPGGATEIGELERALEPPMDGASRSGNAP